MRATIPAALFLLCVLPVSACGSKTVAPKGISGTSGTVGTTGGSDDGAAPANGGAAAMGGEASEGGAPSEGGVSQGGSMTSQGGVDSGSTNGTTLGSRCATPGALACAGVHQKLSLLCGADLSWEPNQTCPAGQFCNSQSGPDLGTCGKPAPGCENQDPAFRFCDNERVMECGPDTLTTSVVETCHKGCADAACIPVQCDPLLLFSSDPDCAGSLGASYDLCAGPAPTAKPPLVDTSALDAGKEYTISLPSVSATSSCTCESAQKLSAFAYRFSPPPSGSFLQVKVSAPWQLRTASYKSVPSNGCRANIDGQYCELVGGTEETIVWISTEMASAAPVLLTLRRGSFAETDCFAE